MLRAFDLGSSNSGRLAGVLSSAFCVVGDDLKSRLSVSARGRDSVIAPPCLVDEDGLLLRMDSIPVFAWKLRLIGRNYITDSHRTYPVNS